MKVSAWSKPRRVQRRTPYTLTVTLPKSWTALHRLKGGDRIRCGITNDGVLVIIPYREVDHDE